MPFFSVDARTKEGQPWMAIAEAENDSLVRESLDEMGLQARSITPTNVLGLYVMRAYRFFFHQGVKLLISAVTIGVAKRYGKELILYGHGSVTRMIVLVVLSLLALLALAWALRGLLVPPPKNQGFDKKRKILYHIILSDSSISPG